MTITSLPRNRIFINQDNKLIPLKKNEKGMCINKQDKKLLEDTMHMRVGKFGLCFSSVNCGFVLAQSASETPLIRVNEKTEGWGFMGIPWEWVTEKTQAPIIMGEVDEFSIEIEEINKDEIQAQFADIEIEEIEVVKVNPLVKLAQTYLKSKTYNETFNSIMRVIGLDETIKIMEMV